MDDFNIGSLHESRNEWCARLLTILTPLVIEGFKSILVESVKLCNANQEPDKYLMTFQNLLQRIPRWNPTLIETERKRIVDKSGCLYLEDLVTCVHIIQLKVLTAVRVGQKQKKIDISIPKIDDFIHKVYIMTGRKVYKNAYLFQVNIEPLQMQKNGRELEIIVQESILNTIRESIPVESILKAYMDESVEEDITEEVKEEIIHEPIPQEQISNISEKREDPTTSLSNLSETKNLPETKGNNVTQWEPSFKEYNEYESTNNDDNMKLKITDENVKLDVNITNLKDESEIQLLPDLLLDDIELLD
jgi:hypothetical protein